ncbi:dTDP-glucose 4,6-dehydratase [Patescibacteria group bacterium]|nr:dTDP-glucose 4,6-dehydratase [Patescibacteria group bacterium]HPD07649.1 dTDP-glucose 4,6-dehydratase [bacterium]HRT10964.1 dTDP-glucose 4,6-dehydratase [Patescibacteria group bacterium]HRU89815.1 dTDP-glucose 4,6-dehydratase [Patescibacteria group bacterium]
MKLLVTGGAGFIGSNFIHYWLKKHPADEIINLDLLTYAGNLANLADVADQKNYRFVKGDIASYEVVDELVGQVDCIVNFAAETHVDRSINNGLVFVKTNTEGTANLLEAARQHGGVRFHQVSTDEVYGDLGPNDPKFNELSPYRPSSPYSASKAAADHLTRAYYRTYNLPITISNCSNNYGPYQYPEKFIPLFITNLIEDRKVPLYGQGTNIRDWIHVDDHNAGLEAILLHGRIGETYCLGGNHEVSNIELAKEIIRLLGKDESYIELVTDRPGHDWRYSIDFHKAKEELGWEPRIDFASGLKDTVEWYKTHEAWWRPLKARI